MALRGMWKILSCFNENFSVDASCCACVILESHKTALSAMKFCQINVIEKRWDKFKA